MGGTKGFTMIDYYIFGIQRSGTNFVEATMKNNFAIRKTNTQKNCWKHSITVPKSYKTNSPTIVIYKNPYTWVESIAFRNSVDWVRTQVTYPAKEPCDDELKVGEDGLNVTNLAKTYNHFYTTWLLNTPGSNTAFIKYEDLLVPSSRLKIFENVQTNFALQRKGSNLVFPEKGAVSQSKDYTNSREDYYRKQMPEHLTKVQIDEISRILDDRIFEKTGYTRLS
jgi:hypothetical protein